MVSTLTLGEENQVRGLKNWLTVPCVKKELLSIRRICNPPLLCIALSVWFCKQPLAAFRKCDFFYYFFAKKALLKLSKLPKDVNAYGHLLVFSWKDLTNFGGGGQGKVLLQTPPPGARKPVQLLGIQRVQKLLLGWLLNAQLLGWIPFRVSVGWWRMLLFFSQLVLLQTFLQSSTLSCPSVMNLAHWKSLECPSAATLCRC